MGDPTTDNYIVTGGFFDRPTGCLNADGKTAGSVTQQDAETGMLVAHSLRADGFDASEDGTGRGTPLIQVANHMTGVGFWQEGLGTLRAREQDSHENLIAFSCKDSGADSSEVAPTLRSMNFSGSHANAGGQIAIAIQERAICENPLAGPDGVGVREDDRAYTVEARQIPQAVAFNLRGRKAVRCRSRAIKLRYVQPAEAAAEPTSRLRWQSGNSRPRNASDYRASPITTL